MSKQLKPKKPKEFQREKKVFKKNFRYYKAARAQRSFNDSDSSLKYASEE